MSLRTNAKGPAVQQVQERLNRDGAHLDVDAKYGDKTIGAVKKFQKEHGLEADGVVGKKTAAAMGLSGDAFEPAKAGAPAPSVSPQGNGGKPGPAAPARPTVVTPRAPPTAHESMRRTIEVYNQVSASFEKAKANGQPIPASAKEKAREMANAGRDMAAQAPLLGGDPATAEAAADGNDLRLASDRLEKAAAD
jgi:peptidoglycan hydrolase-like protein with peptidoglycan-binding domain